MSLPLRSVVLIVQTAVGYWENTAYIATDDLGAITKALSCLGASEGRIQVYPLPRRTALDVEVPDRVGIALIPGALGWTVLKTSPLEWLVKENRLAQLCSALQVDGFQYNVYDGECDSLLEADFMGRTRVSGMGSGEDGPANFRLLPIEQFVATTNYGAVVTGAIPDELMSMPSESTSTSWEEHKYLMRCWLSAVDGEWERHGRFWTWTAPSHEVCLTMVRDPMIELSVKSKALALADVFAAGNMEATDNLTSVMHLAEHHSIPKGKALYLERSQRASSQAG